MTYQLKERHRLTSKTRRNSGFVLLEMVIAVTIAGLMMIMYYWHEQAENQKIEAADLAKNIVQYTQAVSEYIADYPGKLSKTGVSWLIAAHRPPTTNESYLPANFTLNSPLWSYTDNNITTNISAANTANAEIQVTGFATALSGAMVAKAARSLSAKESSQFSYTYLPQNAQIDIRFISKQSNSETDWLSITGKNSMESSFNFDDSKPDSDHQMNNVSTINFTNNHNSIGSISAVDGQLSIGTNSNKVTLGSVNSTNLYANDIYLSTLNGETISQAIHNQNPGNTSIKTFDLYYEFNPVIAPDTITLVYSLDLKGCYVEKAYPTINDSSPYFVLTPVYKQETSYKSEYTENNWLVITLSIKGLRYHVYTPRSSTFATVYVFCTQSSITVNPQK
ncbi:type II secretion system protein [Caedibacter taeniospiralis]|uniref:type II secretion system protein n=1 Tax=Caedibacter taeniospiralis TaxID=28907 RepID=UPI000C27157A|nr:prepilin-type N-terminal cleavage/methylation domain-containing protein [Caedibacter taeniospiralis]